MGNAKISEFGAGPITPTLQTLVPGQLGQDGASGPFSLDELPLFAAVVAALAGKAANGHSHGTGDIAGLTDLLAAFSAFMAAGDKGNIIVGGDGQWTIDAGVVTNARLFNMATGTIKGRITNGTADPEDLTAAQVASMLPLFGAAKGLVPASPGGTAYLRADGTWGVPAAGDLVSMTQFHASNASQALLGAYTAGNVLVHCPPGTFEIDPAVFGRPRNKVILRGSGVGQTTFKLPNGANADLFVFDGLSQYCGLENLTIDMNKTNNTAGRGIVTVPDATDASVPGGRQTYLYTLLKNLIVKNAKETGIHLEPIYYAMSLIDINVRFCDGHGLYNKTTDNFFQNIWSEGNKGVGLYEAGANNCWLGGKIIWNGSGTPSVAPFAAEARLPGILVKGSSRFRMGLFEAQDNSREGIVFENSRDLVCEGMLVDRNSHAGIGTHDGLVVLNTQALSFSGAMGSYQAGNWHKRPYDIDNSSEGIDLNLRWRQCAQIPRALTRSWKLLNRVPHNREGRAPITPAANPTFLATSGTGTYEAGPYGDALLLNKATRDRLSLPFTFDAEQSTIELRFNTKSAAPDAFGRIVQAGSTGATQSQLMIGWGTNGAPWVTSTLLVDLYLGNGTTRVGTNLQVTGIAVAADQTWWVTVKWKKDGKLAARVIVNDVVYRAEANLNWLAGHNFNAATFPTWLLGSGGNANDGTGIRVEDLRVSSRWVDDVEIETQPLLGVPMPVDGFTTIKVTPNDLVMNEAGRTPLVNLPIVQLTQAAYNALTVKDPGTLYLVTA